MWILDRCEGKADAVETPIGYVPKAEDINIEGLDIDRETVEGLLEVDKKIWSEEAEGITEFYSKFDRLPKELAHQLEMLKERLK